MSEADRTLIFKYENHKNVVSERCVIPHSIWYGVTHWYPFEKPTWFLRAQDLDKDAMRDFMLNRFVGDAFNMVAPIDFEAAEEEPDEPQTIPLVIYTEPVQLNAAGVMKVKHNLNTFVLDIRVKSAEGDDVTSNFSFAIDDRNSVTLFGPGPYYAFGGKVIIRG